MVEPAFEQLLALAEFPRDEAGDKGMTWKTPEGWERRGRKPSPTAVATLTPEGMRPARDHHHQLGRWARRSSRTSTAGVGSTWACSPIHPRALPKVVSKSARSAAQTDHRGRPARPGRHGPAANAPDPKGEATPATRPSPCPSRYKVPAGWEEGGTSMMVVASLSVSEGGETARLTVTPLSKIDAGRAARQRQPLAQRGRPAADRRGRTEDVKMPDDQGRRRSRRKMLDLEGKETRSLVVWFERGETTWFFKFSGPTKLVGAEGQEFREIHEVGPVHRRCR